jgi:hypothetical protein
MHIPWSSGSMRPFIYLLSTSKTNIVTRFSNSILFTFVIRHFKILAPLLSSSCQCPTEHYALWNTTPYGTLCPMSVQNFNNVSHYNNHVTYQTVTNEEGKLQYVKYNKHKNRTTLATRPIHMDNHLDIGISVNSNCVDTRWQYTFTHQQYIQHRN